MKNGIAKIYPTVFPVIPNSSSNYTERIESRKFINNSKTVQDINDIKHLRLNKNIE